MKWIGWTVSQHSYTLYAAGRNVTPSAQDGIGYGMERPEANHHMTQMQPSASKIAISNLTRPHHIATPRPVLIAVPLSQRVEVTTTTGGLMIAPSVCQTIPN